MLGMNKMKSLVDKNNQRQMIVAFFELVRTWQYVKLQQRIIENELITRSIANDSILQCQYLQTVNS